MVLADDFKKMYKQKFKEMEKAYEKQVSWIHSVCFGCHCVCAGCHWVCAGCHRVCAGCHCVCAGCHLN